MKKYQFITISLLLYLNMNLAWYYSFKDWWNIIIAVYVLLGLLVKEEK